ncbi:hypothetical protein AB0M31_23360 [Streptomyces sp. NPDC051773]|uniref:hypothetical protein n=1 Tax=Streptomyces sp. NPDC051773 TaxID=3156682 RepID=UPI00341441A2
MEDVVRLLRGGVTDGVRIVGRAFRKGLGLDAARVIEDRLGALTPVDPRGGDGSG